MYVCSNKYGRHIGTYLGVKTYLTNLVAGESSSYFTLSDLPTSLSFTLSVSQPDRLGGETAKSQGLKVCEKTWLDRSSKCHRERSCVSTRSLVCDYQQTCQEAV